MSKPDPNDTVRMTFHIDVDLAERLRNAIYWTKSSVTLSGTAREALWDAVQRIESRHNNGLPFPARNEELQGGRPIEM